MRSILHLQVSLNDLLHTYAHAVTLQGASLV
nr:MAG TPA: hypothetical protein [Caudoviricetes sp.]